MRVLLIDDGVQYAPFIQQELQRSFGMEVTFAPDPLVAEPLLREQRFDVVVADVLYKPLTDAYSRRRLAREISLTRDQEFHVSGLAVHPLASPKGSGVVLWSSGEENRGLHLMFAHQTLGVRSYCSKGVHVSKLAEAIEAAARGASYHDPLLDAYLPPADLRPVSDLLFGRELWRGVWRALALQVRGLNQVADLIGYARRTVRNRVSEMAEALCELNPGLSVDGAPSDVLVSYADRHWEFFLDDTVMRLFPPPGFKPNG